MLTLRDTSKEFKLKGDLLEMITRKYYNVDLAGLSDKKFIYDFAKEMYFDVKAQGNKFTRVRTLMKLLKIPGLRIHASGISNTMFLSSDPKKLCNRLKCDYLRYSPSKISTINAACSQIYINITREDSVISLLNSYLDLINFVVIHAATSNRYANGIDIR